MSALLVALRLGLHDLLRHLRLALVMALLIAVALTIFAILETYRGGLAGDFEHISDQWLVVQESQSFGEFYGSRLSDEVGEQLAARGIRPVVPEIHVITGTSVQDATLLRGIDLPQYRETETFTLVAGQSLQQGDASRLAMIGSLLAQNRQAAPGDILSLRGRNFTVVGIFHTGTYADNEAWISLPDAQELLGWGRDVSVYIIPDDGLLAEGDLLSEGVSVARRGVGMRVVAYQYQPIIDLLNVVALTLGAATVLAMTNIFWRLAWLRRRELAILRTVGFPTYSLVGYLLSQVAGVTLVGILMSALATVVFTSSVDLAVSGFTIVPKLDFQAVLTSLGWAAVLVIAGSLLPAWWLSHMNLAQLLHAE